jgi:cytochrome c551/c552
MRISVRAASALLILLVGCSSSSSPSTTKSPSSPSDAGTTGKTDSDGAATQDTWASYAEGFFQQYCVSCHDASDTTGRDYTVAANVAKDHDAMRCGVAATQDPTWQCASLPTAKQFPIGSGPKPSDAERARIVAWINAGEP